MAFSVPRSCLWRLASFWSTPRPGPRPCPCLARLHWPAHRPLHGWVDRRLEPSLNPATSASYLAWALCAKSHREVWTPRMVTKSSPAPRSKESRAMAAMRR